jgi:hypothetical protein
LGREKRLFSNNSVLKRTQVTLADVGVGGLTTDVYPHNWAALHGRCNGSSMYPGTCGWGAIQLASGSWLNASVAASGVRQLTLTAAVPAAESSDGRPPTATAYAWAPVPLMNAYDKGSGLPVLPWNRSIAGGTGEGSDGAVM